MMTDLYVYRSVNSLLMRYASKVFGRFVDIYSLLCKIRSRIIFCQ